MLSMGKSTISMAIFNSYVNLPEGTSFLVEMWHIQIALSWERVKTWGKKNIALKWETDGTHKIDTGIRYTVFPGH